MTPKTSSVTDPSLSLLQTDLYQLNMVEAYLAEGMTAPASFELFVRKLPPCRGFLMAAGLAQAVGYLLHAGIDEAEIAWLRETGRFTERLIEFLRDFRFEGSVEALPEGTVFFPDEPLIRVTAPLPQAQLVETRLLNLLHFQTLIASKAARMVLAAPDAALVDFGMRRAHSAEAGTQAARAAWIAGFAGTASVPAGRLHDIPLYGTMAHSFVQAHESETAAFEAFARARPDQTVFLLDTFDTERAARKLAGIAPRLAQEGISTRGVRLDSGDLGAHAREVRRILDDAGLGEAKIVASGGLDEYELAALTAQGAPIEVYGVGTSLVVSDDLPGLDCAYKLKSYAGQPKRKRSEKKAYWPGDTQVWRRRDADGRLAGDTIAAAGEAAEGEALLQPVLRDGRPVGDRPDLAAARDLAARELASLPEPLRALEVETPYDVAVTDRLRALADEVDRKLGL
jgi:nicotinate phosphoribosyltransferase